MLCGSPFLVSYPHRGGDRPRRERIGVYRTLIGKLRWRLRSARLVRRVASGEIEPGAAAEQLAALHLERLGYRIVARNFQSRGSEIDLIAVAGDELVFVEVKSRRQPAKERPERNVSRRKQAKLRAAARAYVAQHALCDPRIQIRFDVIAILWPQNGGDFELRHIRSAFEVSPRNTEPAL